MLWRRFDRLALDPMAGCKRKTRYCTGAEKRRKPKARGRLSVDVGSACQKLKTLRHTARAGMLLFLSGTRYNRTITISFTPPLSSYYSTPPSHEMCQCQQSQRDGPAGVNSLVQLSADLRMAAAGQR